MTTYDPARSITYRHPGLTSDAVPLTAGYSRRVPVAPVQRMTARPAVPVLVAAR